MVSSIGRGEATQGKPGVTSIACATGHCTGKTERGLSTQPAAILRFVCRPTQTCSESWPWPQNKWVSRTHCGTMTSECCTETLNDFYCVFVTLSAVYFSCMYSRCDMSTWIFMRIYGYETFLCQLRWSKLHWFLRYRADKQTHKRYCTPYPTTTIGVRNNNNNNNNNKYYYYYRHNYWFCAAPKSESLNAWHWNMTRSYETVSEASIAASCPLHRCCYICS